MAFTPCTESSSCMKVATRGNALTVEPILEGNPASDSWPYKNCTAGAANGLHCGPDGMWADPTFCTDYVEYSMDAVSGSLRLNRTEIGVETDVTERLRIDNSSEDQFCNNSCFPVVAMIDVQWPWVNYAGADGVAFDVLGNASLPCANGKEFLKGSVNTGNYLNPAGPAPSQGTVIGGGSRRFFCKLCPGECLGPIEMWISTRIVTTDPFKKINSVCYIEDVEDPEEGDSNGEFTVFYTYPDGDGNAISQTINGDSPEDPPETSTSNFDFDEIQFSHGPGQINIITMPDCNRTDCPC